MEYGITFWCICLGIFLIIEQTACNENAYLKDSKSRSKRSIADFSDGSLCRIPSTKRLLKSLGIVSSKRCLLQSKRDIASLVSTYLNADPIQLTASQKRESSHNNWHSAAQKPSHRLKQQSLSDALEYAIDDMLDHRTKRGKGYCCSPTCDPFMKKLDWPNPSLISCEDK